MMEDIIEKAENDSPVEERLIYMDGGSRQYEYENYRIIKKHTLEGNQDVYIGIPTMILSNDSVRSYY